MVTLSELTAHLPPQLDEAALFPLIERLKAESKRVLVVIDDDPTGTQTVSDVELLTAWDEELLTKTLEREQRLFYLLTNSRSLPEHEAAEMNETIARQLLAASRRTGKEFVVASRSDSTLRGHYPAEIFALERGMGREIGGRGEVGREVRTYDGHLVVPAFFEGGRYTIGDTHYVATPTASSDTLRPAHETPYAQDSAFGYSTAYLPDWIEEKSKGYWRAEQVVSLDLKLIREGGPEAVAERLRAVTGGLPIVVNAAGYGDLAVVVAGVLQAEASGKSFAYRTAASFVRLRGAVATRPLLQPGEIVGETPSTNGGLVIVGSYVPASTAQLEALLALPSVEGIELPVERVIKSEEGAHEISAALARRVDELIQSGVTPVVFTSRSLVTGADSADFLALGRRVSRALIEVVQSVQQRPRFIVAKGGITSHDVARHGLGAERAHVLGQILPGIPVWRLERGPHARFAGVPYIVFPGNVGNPETLREVVQALSVYKKE
ncbi:four-carbon acid sugar kinase family protein [Dictyobacter aurantiacus]|uniref:Hydroxyacid dehydrogenase n=1 Tax=Dictyobacter aurantiacus TaxID=1936993 RepID=A0A401ZIT4_9CHLR|nr:four-carbon acid sugar kinase family protein [Dictyobacter aurantiacus]GCE06771.1 hypothetical protein KDAU_41000 [Dictyobacter aurantiacus]